MPGPRLNPRVVGAQPITSGGGSSVVGDLAQVAGVAMQGYSAYLDSEQKEFQRQAAQAREMRAMRTEQRAEESHAMAKYNFQSKIQDDAEADFVSGLTGRMVSELSELDAVTDQQGPKAYQKIQTKKSQIIKRYISQNPEYANDILEAGKAFGSNPIFTSEAEASKLRYEAEVQREIARNDTASKAGYNVNDPKEMALFDYRNRAKTEQQFTSDNLSRITAEQGVRRPYMARMAYNTSSQMTLAVDEAMQAILPSSYEQIAEMGDGRVDVAKTLQNLSLQKTRQRHALLQSGAHVEDVDEAFKLYDETIKFYQDVLDGKVEKEDYEARNVLIKAQAQYNLAPDAATAMDRQVAEDGYKLLKDNKLVFAEMARLFDKDLQNVTTFISNQLVNKPQAIIDSLKNPNSSSMQMVDGVFSADLASALMGKMSKDDALRQARNMNNLLSNTYSALEFKLNNGGAPSAKSFNQVFATASDPELAGWLRNPDNRATSEKIVSTADTFINKFGIQARSLIPEGSDLEITIGPNKRPMAMSNTHPKVADQINRDYLPSLIAAAKARANASGSYTDSSSIDEMLTFLGADENLIVTGSEQVSKLQEEAKAVMRELDDMFSKLGGLTNDK